MMRSDYVSTTFAFLALIVGIIFLLAAGCAPNSMNEANTPAASSGEATPAHGTLQVGMEWTYLDARRLGVELAVTNYPIPPGFQVSCPLTQLTIKDDAGRSLLLYRNPSQITLDEFYAITRYSHWYCKEQTEGNGFANYLFSLIYDYGEDAEFDWNAGPRLRVELGEVNATNSVSVTTLPNQGAFDLLLDFATRSNNLTWLPAATMDKNDVSVEIERVALNPSFALLDACLEYQDHHLWRPIAAISYQDQVFHSTEFLPTFPYPGDPRDVTLQSTRRCYSFSIPLTFPPDSTTPFQIGIDHVQIDNTDPGVVTMQECEDVKKQVESSHPGLDIRCHAYETMDQPQHWYEVIARPPELSALEAYDLVKSAFVRTIEGPWMLELQVK